jgi:diguanylate cyclase (GGDEF)-like protein
MTDDGSGAGIVEFRGQGSGDFARSGSVAPSWLVAIVDEQPGAVEAVRRNLDGLLLGGRPVKYTVSAGGEHGRHERCRAGLHDIMAASAALAQRRGLTECHCGVAAELAQYLPDIPDALLAVRPSGTEIIRIVGTAGRFDGLLDQPLSRLAAQRTLSAIGAAFAARADRGSWRDAVLYLAGQGWEGVFYAAGRHGFDQTSHDLLKLYAQHAALVIDNARLADQVSELADTDRLTGLAARARLAQNLDQLIGQGRAPRALVINIDGFSEYEARRGDTFGRALLRVFAQRLLAVRGDLDCVGRLYRDVFCLILDGQDAEALRRLLHEPIAVADETLRLGLSFGLSAAFEPGMAAADIIRQAEIALKSAKQLNRQDVIPFSAELSKAHRARAAMAHDLREALELGGVSVAYQAQVDAKTDRLVGAEALLRWTHPARGAVSPLDFIEAAETCGLIGDVGRWVTRQACREMKPLIESGKLDRVMINLSPVQLRDPNCLDELAAIVEAEGLPCSAIEWEITESAMLGGSGVVAQLHGARARGFTLALDDFGTGYSSLSMIRKLPLNVVKIDRSFLLEVATSQNAWSILFSIASICEDLGLDMVAEGVETKAQLKVVRDANIGTLQGYLVSKPLSADRFQHWLEGRA